MYECNAYNNLSMHSWEIVRATWKLRRILFQDSRPEHHNTPTYCTFQLRLMITPLGDNFAFLQLHPHSLSQSNRVIFKAVGWAPRTVEIFFFFFFGYDIPLYVKMRTFCVTWKTLSVNIFLLFLWWWISFTTRNTQNTVFFWRKKIFF